MTAKQPFRGKTQICNVFYFILILTCMSNILYAGGETDIITVIAIGVHYKGQPDDTWIVKEIANSPEFTYQDNHISPAIEMGVAGDLPAGIVDKLAIKGTMSGGQNGRGWMSDADAEDWSNAAIPPADAANFLTFPGGSNIILETNSNKKIIEQMHTEGSDSVVISDM